VGFIEGNVWDTLFGFGLAFGFGLVFFISFYFSTLNFVLFFLTSSFF